MTITRRSFVAAIASTAALPVFADALGAQAAPAQQAGALLPLHTPKIDHLDIVVPDVAASARFYMGVFNTTLHAQPFQGGFRYFVLFGDLPEATRQVGYVAIGESRGRPTSIGHFCTSVFDAPSTRNAPAASTATSGAESSSAAVSGARAASVFISSFQSASAAAARTRASGSLSAPMIRGAVISFPQALRLSIASKRF